MYCLYWWEAPSWWVARGPGPLAPLNPALHRIGNDCIQQKNVVLNKPGQPKWFKKDIAKQIGERQKAHKWSKIYPTQENIEFHRQKCRKVDSLIKKKSEVRRLT